jgi:two-component sensor histidine kinase
LVVTLTRKRIVLRACSETIKKTLDVVQSMLKLAEEGDAVREDVGCGVLYAVLRDSAYKIKKLAEAEREAHVKKGWWEEEIREVK